MGVVPCLVESFVDVRAKNGYRRIFSFTAPPGTVLVQEVRTRVRYLCGDEPRVDFTSVYGEYFALGHGDTLAADDDALRDMRDVHAFDLRRDGWTLSALHNLLRRRGIKNAQGKPVRGSGPARIECEKRFLVAPGAIEDSPPLKTNGDQAFGFLLSGPLEQARAQLVLNGGPGGTQLTVEPSSPFPYGSDGSGSGRFVGGEGHALCERFSFDFATDSLTFGDGEGYQRVPLGG